MKVFFHTLGCKVNQYETEVMRRALINSGSTQADFVESADIIVVNSCTVTAESDRKTRQLVRRYRRLSQDAVIVLTGCMPQAFPKEAEDLPADIILGNGSSRDIMSAIDRFFTTGERVVIIPPHQKGEKFEKCSLDSFSERTRAYMKIEDGCDRGCTYCIIPKARGRVRSRSLEDIEAEARRLGENGFLELVLVGINLSSFGIDTGHTLADAVEAVAKVPQIKRIRLGSLEPDLTDTALLDRLKRVEKFCPQFHLSLQSGCDETLKRMNRLYNTDQYRKLVEDIRSRWENSSITTDIMVGFIGESEEEFQSSLAFAKEIGFLKAHIFPYSIRKGTAAATMPCRVEGGVKTTRAEIMAKECNAVSLTLMKKMCGQTCSVLFETREEEYIVGYSENYTPVYVKADISLLHNIKKVRLIHPFKDGIVGEIV